MAVTEVRIGLVGCGVHAREVLLPAAQRAGMQIAAVCDLDKRLAQRTKSRFGAFRTYQDLGAMIDEMDLDATLVCGPPELHAEAAETSLREGCHVFTEMPAAPTAEEAEAIASLAEAKGLVALPGLMMRFAPACARLREIVQAEDFGEIGSIEVTWWPPKTHGHDDPMVFDLPHAMDLVRFIGGDVGRITAARAAGGPLVAAMELVSGAVASVSFNAPSGCPRELLAVAGPGAVATVQDRRQVTLRHADREETTVWGARACDTDASARAQGFLPQMEHFAAAVAGEQEPVATMADAAEALRLAEQVAATQGS